MTKIIAFDVNETLLDLRVLDAPFHDLLGDRALRGQWFAQMLQLSFVGGLTNRYVDFRQAQEAALHMIAARTGRTLANSDVTEMVERMTTLPPHAEVASALSHLRAHDVTVVALVNSLHEVGEAQLTNAGLREFFHAVISADSVRELKPAPAPYHAVAERFDVPISEVRLVAAHSWDITGALSAGARAAFVARPGMVLSPLGPQPDIVAPDIAAVVRAIVSRDLQAGKEMSA